MENRIKVVVFDLGNVLLPFNYQIAIDKLNKIETGLGERFYSRYQENYPKHRSFERGDISESFFIDLLRGWAEKKVSASEICSIYSEIFIENTGVSELLPLLKQKFRLVLLSNTNSIHMEYGWKNYEFLKNFEKYILSHEVGSVKPEEAIYREVEKHTCEESSSHIFIDDIEEYALAARKCGWDSIHFQGADNLKEQLRLRGIL